MITSVSHPIENSDEETVDNAKNPMLEPLIAQMRDLFPELGEGFLAQCLAYFDSNTEKVINALLEDNLPPHLAKMDRALTKPSQPPVIVDQVQGSLFKGIDKCKNICKKYNLNGNLFMANFVKVEVKKKCY